MNQPMDLSADALLAGTCINIQPAADKRSALRSLGSNNNRQTSGSAAQPEGRLANVQPTRVRISLKARRPGPAYSSPDSQPLNPGHSSVECSPLFPGGKNNSDGHNVSTRLSPRATAYKGAFNSPFEKLLRASQNYALPYDLSKTNSSPPPQPEAYPGVFPHPGYSPVRQSFASQQVLLPSRTQLAIQCASQLVDPVTAAFANATQQQQQQQQQQQTQSFTANCSDSPKYLFQRDVNGANQVTLAVGQPGRMPGIQRTVQDVNSSMLTESTSPKASGHSTETASKMPDITSGDCRTNDLAEQPSFSCFTGFASDMPAAQTSASSNSQTRLQVTLKEHTTDGTQVVDVQPDNLSVSEHLPWSVGVAGIAVGDALQPEPTQDATLAADITAPSTRVAKFNSTSHEIKESQRYRQISRTTKQAAGSRPRSPSPAAGMLLSKTNSSQAIPARAASAPHTSTTHALMPPKRHLVMAAKVAVVAKQSAMMCDGQLNSNGLKDVSSCVPSHVLKCVEDDRAQSVNFEDVHVLLSSIQMPGVGGYSSNHPPVTAGREEHSEQQPCVQKQSPARTSSPARQLLPCSPCKSWPRILDSTSGQPNPPRQYQSTELTEDQQPQRFYRLHTAAAVPLSPAVTLSRRAAGMPELRVSVDLGKSQRGSHLEKFDCAVGYSMRVSLSQAQAVLERDAKSLLHIKNGNAASILDDDMMSPACNTLSCDMAEELPQPLRLLPPRVLRLKSMAAVIAAQHHMISRHQGHLASQLHANKREYWLAKALDMGLRLGMSKLQLQGLRRQVPESAVNTFNMTVLVGAIGRLRAQLAFTVWRQLAGGRKQQLLLAEHVGYTLSRIHLPAIFMSWRYVASQCAAVNKMILHHKAGRLRRNAQLMVAMWHLMTQYHIQIRTALDAALSSRKQRTQRRTLTWWRTWTQYQASLVHSTQRLHDWRLTRLLHGWSEAAAQEVAWRRKALIATASYVRGLMTAAFAHWRTLHLQVFCKSAWLKGIAAWRVLHIKGRVMQQWYFIARRSAQVICQATAHHKGWQGVRLAVSAPMTMHCTKTTAQNLLSATAFLIEAAADEMRHLSRFCRLTLCPPTALLDLPGGPQAALLAGYEIDVQEPAGLLTALLKAAGAEPQQATTAPMVLPNKHRVEDCKPMRDQDYVTASVNVTFCSLLEDDADLHVTNPTVNGDNEKLMISLTEQDCISEPAGLPDQHLLVNQWQYKHEVTYLLQELHSAVTLIMECDQQETAEKARADQLKAALQARNEELRGWLSSKKLTLQDMLTKQALLQQDVACCEEQQQRTTQLKAMQQQAQSAESAARCAAGAVHDAEQALQDAEANTAQLQAPLQAAQQRLNEALAISSELSHAVRQVTDLAAKAPAFQVQRHQSAQQEAKEQLAAAQHVVMLAQAEVNRQELLTCQAADHAANCQKQLVLAREQQCEAAMKARDAVSAAQAAAANIQVGSGRLYDVQSAGTVAGCERQHTALLQQLHDTQTQAANLQRECKQLQPQVDQVSQELGGLDTLLNGRLLQIKLTRTKAQALALQLREHLAMYPPALVQAVAHMLDQKQADAPLKTSETFKTFYQPAIDSTTRTVTDMGVGVGPNGVLHLPTPVLKYQQAQARRGVKPKPWHYQQLGISGLPRELLHKLDTTTVRDQALLINRPQLKANESETKHSLAAGLILEHGMEYVRAVKHVQTPRHASPIRKRKCVRSPVRRAAEVVYHTQPWIPPGVADRPNTPSAGLPGISTQITDEDSTDLVEAFNHQRQNPAPQRKNLAATMKQLRALNQTVSLSELSSISSSLQEPQLPLNAETALIAEAAAKKHGVNAYAEKPTSTQAAGIQHLTATMNRILSLGDLSTDLASQCSRSSYQDANVSLQHDTAFQNNALLHLRSQALISQHQRIEKLQQLHHVESQAKASRQQQDKTSHVSSNPSYDAPIRPEWRTTLRTYPVSQTAETMHQTSNQQRSDTALHLKACAPTTILNEPLQQTDVHQQEEEGTEVVGSAANTKLDTHCNNGKKSARKPHTFGTCDSTHLSSTLLPHDPCHAHNTNARQACNSGTHQDTRLYNKGVHRQPQVESDPLQYVHQYHSVLFPCEQDTASIYSSSDAASFIEHPTQRCGHERVQTDSQDTSQRIQQSAYNHDSCRWCKPTSHISLQQVTPSPAADRLLLAATLKRAHCLIRHSLQVLKLTAVSSKARRRVAAHRGHTSVQRWAIRTWHAIAQSNSSNAKQRVQSFALSHYFARWSWWSSRKARLRETSAAVVQHTKHRLMHHALMTLKMAALHQAVRAACIQACYNARARRILHFWRGKVQARQLLGRVFWRAEKLWDERDAAMLYGRQFQLLQHVMHRWADFVVASKQQRADNVLCATADAHWSTRTALHVMRCLEAAVASRWHDLCLKHLLKKAMYKWGVQASDMAQCHTSRHAVRQRLRKHGYTSETHVYQHHLMCRALWCLASRSAVAAHLHCDRHVLRKALGSWVQHTRRQHNKLLEHQRHRQHAATAHAWAAWREWHQHSRHWTDLANIATALHNRRVLRRAFEVWEAWRQDHAAMSQANAIAVVYRVGLLKRRTLAAWRAGKDLNTQPAQEQEHSSAVQEPCLVIIKDQSAKSAEERNNIQPSHVESLTNMEALQGHTNTTAALPSDPETACEAAAVVAKQQHHSHTTAGSVVLSLAELGSYSDVASVRSSVPSCQRAAEEPLTDSHDCSSISAVSGCKVQPHEPLSMLLKQPQTDKPTPDTVPFSGSDVEVPPQAPTHVVLQDTPIVIPSTVSTATPAADMLCVREAAMSQLADEWHRLWTLRDVLCNWQKASKQCSSMFTNNNVVMRKRVK